VGKKFKINNVCFVQTFKKMKIEKTRVWSLLCEEKSNIKGSELVWGKE